MELVVYRLGWRFDRKLLGEQDIDLYPFMSHDLRICRWWFERLWRNLFCDRNMRLYPFMSHGVRICWRRFRWMRRDLFRDRSLQQPRPRLHSHRLPDIGRERKRFDDHLVQADQCDLVFRIRISFIDGLVRHDTDKRCSSLGKSDDGCFDRSIVRSKDLLYPCLLRSGRNDLS